jgi:hypothetical protein
MSNHTPVQLVEWAVLFGVKRPKREADHLPPNAEIKSEWNYILNDFIYFFPELLKFWGETTNWQSVVC